MFLPMGRLMSPHRDLAFARRALALLASLAAVGLAAPAALAGLGNVSGPTPSKPSTKSTKLLSYSELIRTIDADKVASAVITGNTTRTQIKLTLRNGTTATSSYLPSDTLVQQHLVAHHAKVTVASGGTPLLLILLAPLLLLVLLAGIFFLQRRGK